MDKDFKIVVGVIILLVVFWAIAIPALAHGPFTPTPAPPNPNP